jgi:putative endonuclease
VGAQNQSRPRLLRLCYGVDRLVWYEIYERIDEAIAREKNIKKWRRDWKIRLIEEMNPEWSDLYEALNR